MRISDKIAYDIRNRLRDSGTVPFALNLQAIADHYQCSTRPARIAVLELQKLDLIRKRPNGRLEFNFANIDHQEIIPKPHDDSAVEAAIIEDIIKMSLTGSELCIRENATAEKYRIGRTRLRQVLLELSAKGILQHIPNKGWQIRRLTRKDLHDFLIVRDLLEQKALEISFPLLEKEKLERLHERNAPSKKYQRADNSLHDYWISLSDNRYIQNFFVTHAQYFKYIFHWEDNNPEAAEQAIHQHREILECLIDKNLAAAQRSLNVHIFESHPVIEKMLATQ